MADAQARKLNEATLYKYRLLFRQLDSFAETHKLQFLKQLDLDTLAISGQRGKTARAPVSRNSRDSEHSFASPKRENGLSTIRPLT